MQNSNKLTVSNTLADLLNRYLTSNLVVLLAVATIYFLFAQIGLLFNVQPEGLAIFWPASGFVLAILVLNHQNKWFVILAAIFIVNMLANLSVGNSFLTSVGFAVANSAEGLVAAWVVSRFLELPIRNIRSFRALMAILVAAVFANAVTAVLGAMVVNMSFGTPFFESWRLWYISDAVGMSIVAPMIIIFATLDIDWDYLKRPESYVEFISFCAALIIVAQVIFRIPVNVANVLLSSTYLVFPFLLLGAYRFGILGATVASFLLTLITVWNTKQGFGPFLVFGESATEQIIGVQLFLVVANWTALTLAVAISERDQAEKMLIKDHNLLRNLIDTIPDYIYIKDTEGRFLLNNQAHLQSLGETDASKVVGQTGHAFFPKELVDVFVADEQQIVNTGESVIQREEVSLGLDQERIWASTTKVPFYDDNNELLGIIGVTRNVTEQKQLQDQVSQKEQIYRTLVKHIPKTSVLLYDRDLRYLLAEGEIGTQNKTHNIEGQSIYDVLPETDFERVATFYKDTLNGQSASFQHVEDDITYNVQFVPVCDENDEIVAGMVLTQDISDLKKAEEHMIDLAAERERVKLFENFIGDASHDLKTPLSIIATSLHVLKKSKDEAKQARQIEKIESQVRRFKGLLDKLFTMSQIDTYGTRQFVDCDVNNMLQGLHEQLGIMTETKEIELEYQLMPTLPILQANCDDIERLILNLVENAVRFTPSQGKIMITSTVQDQFLVLKVRDTGAGIEADHLEQIFTRFFKVDAARSSDIGGVGLGLSIVKKIMDIHNGRIEVESEIDHGTTFSLYFPI